ncbi:energy transducer TonB [Oleiharenicola lentus]|uniref:energy transducer TonB n=1 Tax=Oleiharenicola lentus TaxID=2508720 RepID=UPI003F6650B9
MALLLVGTFRGEETKSASALIKFDDLKAHGTPPKILKQAHPRYPSSLSRNGTSGSVVVAFVIDTQGDVAKAEVVRSTNPGFNQSALDAVKQWKFKPGEIKGVKVNTLVTQRLDFNLQDRR